MIFKQGKHTLEELYLKFLKKMCKKYSQTMIIVTHDERIAAMADRIIQMKDGRVV